ncbi:MAG: hypothetical protein IJ075_02485 [Lachnospiraceae bacterium]|nr:hypothetical protein [Lachnospiraceae bacterium]MBQ9607594.1 hypothetical protein [Lachnospiraceae bacterium]MBR1522859.1 hypothetical protein [Lachnospiraceae bacterium]
MISPISGSGSFGTYGVWGMGPGMSKGSDIGAENAAGAIGASGAVGAAEEKKPIVNPGESTEIQPGKKVSPAECETCKERKYQDGSDEMVSFKSAQHISPTEAGNRVRAHEQEHVMNAYEKAEEKGGKVLQASVSIHTAICPECGRTYVSGGETNTKIEYSHEEESPYMKARKKQDAQLLPGMNLDLSA